MEQRKRRILPRELARGRSRFEAWRSGRKLGTRIPQPLWSLAIKLAETHGVSRTASVLGLDYYALKRRCESTQSGPESSSPAFIELPPPPLAAMAECVVEFEDGVGARMRVHLKGYDAPDLVALGRNFWNGE